MLVCGESLALEQHEASRNREWASDFFANFVAALVEIESRVRRIHFMRCLVHSSKT